MEERSLRATATAKIITAGIFKNADNIDSGVTAAYIQMPAGATQSRLFPDVPLVTVDVIVVAKGYL